MANLKPNVLLSERLGRIVDDVSETLSRSAFQHPPSCVIQKTYVQTGSVFVLLLVDYAETEVNFVCLVKIRRHAHDLGEGLFGMIEGAITVVQDTNAIPQFGLLITNGEYGVACQHRGQD